MSGADDPLLEARVSDLATGFALGEISEEELRELYELLRDEQGRGSEVARITWETLGIVTDLRAEVSNGFQDTLRHRLSHDRSGRFRSRLWQRLGFGVPALQPVEAPTPSRPLRAAAWVVVTVVAGALLVAALAFALAHSPPARAQVTAMQGAATLDGQPLVPSTVVDARPLAVKPGGQLTLSWPDGSTVTLAAGADGSAPAAATVLANGIELRHGRAWLNARRGFTLKLPDHSGEAAGDDTIIATEILNEHSFTGVRRGILRLDRGRTTLTDNTGTGPSGDYSWLWEWDASRGRLSPGHPAPPDWRLVAEVTWNDPADTAKLSFSGEAKSLTEISCAPGLVIVAGNGRELQRLVVPGSPLLGFRLEVMQRERKNLMVSLGDLALTVPVAEPLNAYQLSAVGGAAITINAFHPLPNPRPPLPVPGW